MCDGAIRVDTAQDAHPDIRCTGDGGCAGWKQWSRRWWRQHGRRTVAETVSDLVVDPGAKGVARGVADALDSFEVVDLAGPSAERQIYPALEEARWVVVTRVGRS